MPVKKAVTLVVLGGISALALTALAFVAISQVTPWPGAMVLRALFDFDGSRRSRALRPHVPGDVGSIRDIPYDPADADALLDVYFPSRLGGTGTVLPTLVWVHGGGWVAGGRAQLAEYASILAARGHTVVVVGYTLAPEATYPVALQQVNRSLSFLQSEGSDLHADVGRIVLAGDSAGAQLAAQLANAITSPAYAALIDLDPAMPPTSLRAVALFAGPYDIELANLDGILGFFLRLALWAYLGSNDIRSDRYAPASVLRFVTADFPPSFISAGDADPLLNHSLALSDALTALGVDVDAVFFGQGPHSGLGHNYQFDLDGDAGQVALARLGAFLDRHQRPLSESGDLVP